MKLIGLKYYSLYAKVILIKERIKFITFFIKCANDKRKRLIFLLKNTSNIRKLVKKRVDNSTIVIEGSIMLFELTTILFDNLTIKFANATIDGKCVTIKIVES